MSAQSAPAPIQVNTDREWEKWGAKDPYFAVITDPEFRRSRFGQEQRQRFFASGEAHLRHILQVCRERLDPNFAPRRALDFGCGVGRVTLALAAKCESVVGLDISAAMLREAESNTVGLGVTNVVYCKSDDALTNLSGKFDFIHSFIVFQHLEISRGRDLFAALLKRLNAGGVCVAHFTYAKTQHAANFGRPPAVAELPAAQADLPGTDPVMLMNPYEVNELLFVMQESGVGGFFTEFTDHGGELGILLYFQKRS